MRAAQPDVGIYVFNTNTETYIQILSVTTNIVIFSRVNKAISYGDITTVRHHNFWAPGDQVMVESDIPKEIMKVLMKVKMEYILGK